DLSSDSGSIGSASVAYKINATQMALHTGGLGVINVTDIAANPITINDSSSGGAFKVTCTGNTDVNDISTSHGSLTVSSAGFLHVLANSVITANDGSVTLQSTNTSTGTIVLNIGAQISTSGTGGPVNIVIGAVPSAPIAGFPPGTVTIN